MGNREGMKPGQRGCPHLHQGPEVGTGWYLVRMAKDLLKLEQLRGLKRPSAFSSRNMNIQAGT